MPVQQVEFEEVKMIEVSDDVLEGACLQSGTIAFTGNMVPTLPAICC